MISYIIFLYFIFYTFVKISLKAKFTTNTKTSIIIAATAAFIKIKFLYPSAAIKTNTN